MAVKKPLIGTYSNKDDDGEDAQLMVDIVLTARIRIDGFGKATKGELDCLASNVDDAFRGIESEYNDVTFITTHISATPVKL